MSPTDREGGGELCYDASMGEKRLMSLVGSLVEVHLLNGKRFLGKVKRQDRDGLTLYCIPLQVLDNTVDRGDLRDQLQHMLHTLFFPHVHIEYVDVGGEPVGFDELFAEWFGHEQLAQFFDYQHVADAVDVE